MTSLVSTRYGIWLGLNALPKDGLGDLAAGIEDLGFSALWLGGSFGEDLSVPAALLGGSTNLVVGTSIANIWRDPAPRLAAAYTKVAEQFGDRFVLGLGAGHHIQTQWNNDQYSKPLARLREYLDELDGSVPPEHRALAALGPKALQLSAERSAGALPYLTTPEHTRQAREIVGGAFLAPEHKVIQESDPGAARTLARGHLKTYLQLPNYVNAWRRLGFKEPDFVDGGSDRLIDALYGWGDDPVAPVREHLAAGADHVAVQPIVAPGQPLQPALAGLAEKLL